MPGVKYNAPMSNPSRHRSFFHRVVTLFGWTRSSSVLLGGFFLIVFLIAYIWWPLAEQVLAYINWSGQWWRYFDWLLVGIFLFMSLTIIARADLRKDALIVFVGMCGGLVIESWGTQTNLWHYFTTERPPLWIIPAWPIASLSIDRITRLMNWGTGNLLKGREVAHTFSPIFPWLYWAIFVGFYGLMLYFIAPTFNKSYTIMALLLCALLIATPTNYRYATLTFLAGAGLGYFLELWGTTRQCWTYYTLHTPPFFAVLAHGMAAVAFWRAGLVVRVVWGKFVGQLRIRPGNTSNPEI
jgi:hypothetical protein